MEALQRTIEDAGYTETPKSVKFAKSARIRDSDNNRTYALPLEVPLVREIEGVK